jgi:DNA-binding CsgD family transcriptional regulator
MAGLTVDRLGRTDVEAVLGFLAEIREMAFDEAYRPELVGRLGDLIPGAHVLYRENDLSGGRTSRMVDAGGTYMDDEDELYWSVGPCPVTMYRSRTGDLAATRLSDVVAWRHYTETALYREYFRPGDIDYMLDLGLQAGHGRQSTLLFCRERGDRDYTERDRVVLETLRPHLRAREARTELLRQSRAATRDASDGRPDAGSALTPREREVVYLAGAGKTNAEIAAELWLSPATVKKHLDNVYQKLGVGSRAAAVSRVQTRREAG